MLDSLSSTQDLESQTDKNTTPVQKQKSAKLAFEGESVDIATTTPVKDNHAASSAIPQITPLDLESPINENTTPFEKQKSAKRASDGEPGIDGSSINRQILEIKMEKSAK
ncbi:hypothetical protein CTI12_AA246830 [Artemisia annua]|uniref:Uncharacterized protein n=1 Tax=Artemisia annua TaxID=35608 RepID=A0A2U1NNY9_ARTAN|nr:hypothetical protein CTI12_AA246830 [Artemisia annua]